MTTYNRKYEAEPLNVRKHIITPTIIAGKVSLVPALYDIVLCSQPKTFTHAFSRLAYIALPITGLTMAFQSITYTAAGLRGKHDLWNYHIAGLSILPMIRKWANMPITALAALYFLSADKITLFTAVKFAGDLPKPDLQMIKPIRAVNQYN